MSDPREFASRSAPALRVEDLTLKFRGLRFVSPETESAYRVWLLPAIAQMMWVGAVASAFTWLAILAMLWVATPDLVGTAAVLVCGLFGPMSAAVLLFSGRARFTRLVVPVTVATNAVSGVATNVLAFLILHQPVVGIAGSVVVTFFAFTVFRLRPVHALLAALPYVVVHHVLLSQYTGVLDGSERLIGLIGVPIITAACIFVGALQDGLSRASFVQERIIAQQSAELAQERARADGLLHAILPREVAETLKRSQAAIARRYQAVTVVFADLVGFTQLAARLEPEALVAVLDGIFSRFDALAAEHGVEKIKTIGDAYMAVAGVPTARADHARAAAELALAMRSAMEVLRQTTGHDLHVRIGVASGPAVAGVIGTHKFAYDLWGDTVNTAARMESHGATDAIQVAESTAGLLHGQFRLEERGVTDIKGKGPMRTFWLLGRAVDAAV